MSGVDRLLAEAARGGRPDGVTLMRLLGEAETEQEARAGLDRAIAAADAGGAVHLRRLQRLWAAHPQAWAVVRSTLDAASHDRGATAPGDALRYWAAVFDRLAATAPEAGVALYALGSAELLDAATAEIVDYADRLGLLDPRLDVLDLGCGIGRLSVALAPRVRTIIGVDIAAGMVAEAQRRCAAIANVRIAQGEGRDLAMLPAGSIDLVVAADVFPYLVQAELGAVHIGEFSRVLRAGGRALILNYSYRGALDVDRAELRGAAADAGLCIVKDAAADLRLWDAVTFLLAKP